MRHLIIEGPNCCGKSYLIKTLLRQKKFKDYEVEHLSGSCPNTKEFHKYLLDYDREMLFDRFFVGETIYPTLFNREPKMSHKDMLDLAKEYKDKIAIIFVDADFEFIIKAYKNKKEEFDYEFVKREKEMFYNRFKELSEIPGLQVFRLKNYKENNDAFRKFIDKVKREVK